jgi:hypothetical protein
MSNHLSCGSQHIDNLMESMEDLSLNCYTYLFVISCLISLDDNFSENISIELKYESKDLLLARVCT